ncbi:concanavalin A-like lectin/glucanase domain-containing protein [Hypoxylon sp. FL0890]|nr:concanavalin A-like lectin/glucanase domain-containing protein [Hypoxylon sp. FL0890]
MPKGGIIGLVTALGLTAQFVSGQLEPDCNPLQANCQPKKAWPNKNYYIDFTKQTSPPQDWTIANNEAVNFTSNGAEFAYAKQGDAPNMWTDFYMLGGRYDIEMKIAPGQGVISSAVLWSDVQDEIDYEFSGNQFGQTPFPPQDEMWAVETNVFAQGKMWDGAATYQKDSYKPAEQFHKYSVEWDEDYMSWYVDDKVVRSIQAKDTPSGFTFPQSPMKLQLGVWGGGDPSNSYWTKQWAGGEIDLKGAPYTIAGRLAPLRRLPMDAALLTQQGLSRTIILFILLARHPQQLPKLRLLRVIPRLQDFLRMMLARFSIPNRLLLPNLPVHTKPVHLVAIQLPLHLLNIPRIQLASHRRAIRLLPRKDTLLPR